MQKYVVSSFHNVGSSKTSTAISTRRKMDSNIPLKKIKRSKSLTSLDSVKFGESEWEKSDAGDDSGVQSDSFVSLEKKVTKLNDICLQQTLVLSELAEQIRAIPPRSAGDEALEGVLADLLQKLSDEREKIEDGGASSLLSAIESRPGLQRRVGDALTELLQSEDLKQRIVTYTSASIQELIKNLFSAEVTSLYVPIMERAHRQLLKHVTRLVATAFADLEENTACNAETLRQTSRTLQAALQRHQTLLQEAFGGKTNLLDAVTATTEKVIERELKQWREELSNATPPGTSESDSGRVDSPSPPPEYTGHDEEPVNVNINGAAGLSPIDRIMITAEVTKLIQDGFINDAFTKALLAMDLSVVVAACRAAAPTLAAAALAQPVLLSMLQQLGTDLVLDTQLKCSYIEYALSNLKPADPVTRAHLPFVAGELRRNLGAFLHVYPHHKQSTRIAAIIDNVRGFL